MRLFTCEASITHKSTECNALLHYFANVSTYSRVSRRITSRCSGYFSSSSFRSNSSNSSYLKQGDTIHPTRLNPSSSIAEPKIIPFGTSTCGTSPFSRSSPSSQRSVFLPHQSYRLSVHCHHDNTTPRPISGGESGTPLLLPA